MWENWEPDPMEAVAMAGIFGLVTLLMLWVMILMISPNAEGRLRGWRRARKLNRRFLSPFSDSATAFPWVMLMVGMGTVGWYVFAKALVESRWYPGMELPAMAFGAFLLVLLTGGMGFHALLEGRGGRVAGLAGILVGVVPLMVGAIVGVMGDRFAVLATWLVGMSPPAAALYVSATVMPITELPRDLVRALPRAFWFWQAVAGLVTLWLLVGLRRSLKSVARQAAEEDD